MVLGFFTLFLPLVVFIVELFVLLALDVGLLLLGLCCLVGNVLEIVLVLSLVAETLLNFLLRVTLIGVVGIGAKSVNQVPSP